MKIFLLFIFVSIGMAQASFAGDDYWNGSWSGSYQLVIQDEQPVECAIELRMNSDQNEVGLRQILTNGCGWDMSILLDRRGKNLFFNGVQVGTIDSEQIEIQNLDLEEKGIKYSAVFLRQADDSLILKESSEFSSGLTDRAIGRLQR